jgi:hypothetical protein
LHVKYGNQKSKTVIKGNNKKNIQESFVST